MSFEGYYQLLCKKGHYFEMDVYAIGDISDFNCPRCKQKIVWWNIVNTTNGSWDEMGNRIDGYVELKLKYQRVCKECGVVLEEIYEMPKTKGYRL